jgi:hypothetical protein
LSAASLASAVCCLIAGFFAALWVAFATYALANDIVSSIAVWAVPVVVASITATVLIRLARRNRRIWIPALVLLVASPAVGFASIWGIAWSRAATIMAAKTAQAEAALREAIPFAFYPGSTIKRGEVYDSTSAHLTMSLNQPPSAALAYYRKTLPRDWVQYRDTNTEHVFVSPASNGVRFSITVDLSQPDRCSIHLAKGLASRTNYSRDNVESKLRDLDGKPLKE